MDDEHLRANDSGFSHWIGRRQLFRTLGAFGTMMACAASWKIDTLLAQGSTPDRSKQGEIPRRKLGRTGVEVSVLGLGGGHLLKKAKDDREAIRLVHGCIDTGITFMDNAWDYYNGRSEEVMGQALRGRRQQVFLMTKVCTHGRGKQVGLRHLEQSLRRLRTDYLDLWQIHEVICEEDAERIFAPGGVIEAVQQAKQEGKVRFVGFTGHRDPTIHLNVLEQQFPFDTCQIPLNVFDATYQSFERTVLPELQRQGIAPIGMKSLCGTGKAIEQGILTAEDALRYVLSLPIATLVSGIDSMEVLRQNTTIARRFTPMPEQEMQALRRRMAAQAADGRFEHYKTEQPWSSCDLGKIDERFQPLEQA